MRFSTSLSTRRAFDSWSDSNISSWSPAPAGTHEIRAASLCRASRRALWAAGFNSWLQQLALENVCKFGKKPFGKVGRYAKFWRACSQLFRRRFFQLNIRFEAFIKIYIICIHLHRSKLNIFTKNRRTNSDVGELSALTF